MAEFLFTFLCEVATKYDETNRVPPTSTGTQSYQETVYGLQETSDDEYKAPASPHGMPLRSCMCMRNIVSYGK